MMTVLAVRAFYFMCCLGALISVWQRPLCWVFGHRWQIERMNLRKHLALAHLHNLAGCDADCYRCGKKWRDFYSPIDEHFGWKPV